MSDSDKTASSLAPLTSRGRRFLRSQAPEDPFLIWKGIENKSTSLVVGLVINFLAEKKHLFVAFYPHDSNDQIDLVLREFKHLHSFVPTTVTAVDLFVELDEVPRVRLLWEKPLDDED